MKFFASLLLIALLCAAAAAYVFYAPVGPPPGTSDDNAIYVDIAPGTGTRTMAAQLERAGVLRSRYAFELLREVKAGKLIAGEYRFNHPAPATEVYSRIVRGDVYFIPLTIPEGYNIFDIAQAVESAHLGSRDAFLAAARSQTSLIADLSPNAPSLEGYLFPDTYRFGRHSTPAELLATMVKRFRQVSAQLGLAADPDLPRTVILASLVEKEVSQDSERTLVAGVFTNRLARNMPLDTDPSVIYAACWKTATAAPSTPPTSSPARPTTPTATPACPRAPSATPAPPRSKPQSAPQTPTTSTSSPMRRATANSPPPSSSTLSRSGPTAEPSASHPPPRRPRTPRIGPTANSCEAFARSTHRIDIAGRLHQ